MASSFSSPKYFRFPVKRLPSLPRVRRRRFESASSARSPRPLPFRPTRYVSGTATSNVVYYICKGTSEAREARYIENRHRKFVKKENENSPRF